MATKTKEANRPKVGDRMEQNGMDTVLAAIGPTVKGCRSETWTSDGRDAHLGHWCDCGGGGNDLYYEHLVVDAADGIVSRSHGWFCRICRKVTQTG